MKKDVLSLMMVIVMVMALLTGCSGKKESDTPAGPKITDGYYTDDSTGTVCFIHFNEDGTYYSSYFSGSVRDAGTYEVREEELQYFTDGGEDGDYKTEEDNGFATATQIVVLKSYTSGTEQKIAYVEDALVDMSMAGMANHRTMLHDAEYAYDPAVDEVPIELYVFYANNSISSNFILSHNNTFADVTGDRFVEGSWSLAADSSYALVYDDGTKGSLTVEEGGKTATLTFEDGTVVELKDNYEEESEATVMMSLRSEEVEVGLPMKVAIRLDGYSDDTCKLIVEVVDIGAELEADAGTYTLDPAMNAVFSFEKAGEVNGSPNYATATENSIDLTVAYKADVEVEFNGTNTALSIDSELTGAYKIAE